MPTEAANRATQREWRELGFYYDLDEIAKEWRIEGSAEGLLRFADCLKAYSEDPRKAGISEHEHYGPYSYLEIGTWHEAQITDHWIAGRQEQLSALAMAVRSFVEGAIAGQKALLRAHFAPASGYELKLVVKEPSFDPAQADSACW